MPSPSSTTGFDRVPGRAAFGGNEQICTGWLIMYLRQAEQMGLIRSHDTCTVEGQCGSSTAREGQRTLRALQASHVRETYPCGPTAPPSETAAIAPDVGEASRGAEAAVFGDLPRLRGSGGESACNAQQQCGHELSRESQRR